MVCIEHRHPDARGVLALAALLAGCGSAPRPAAPAPQGPAATRATVSPSFGPSAARTLALGADFSCALSKERGVACFGGPARQGREPWEQEAVAGLSGVVELVARDRRACARLERGEVWCWTAGGTASEIRGLADAAELALGEGGYGCARTSGGAARCWGEGSGEAERIDGVSGAVGIALAKSAACARTDLGEVVCWGRLGGRDEPPKPVPSLTQVRQIAGHDELCALGPGLTITCLDPTTLALSARQPAATDDAALLAGPGWGCSASGLSLSCWGAHPFVGPDRAAGLSPALASSVVSELAAGGAHVCARAAPEAGVGQRTLCWGDNRSGQLGGPTPDAIAAPARVEGLDDAKAIASGDEHSCVLRSSGKVACFGAADRLALGAVRATGQRWVEVAGISDATALDAAGAHTCVVHDGGKVACFGLGSDGQLGAGAPLAPGLAKSMYFSEYIRGAFASEQFGFEAAIPYADTIGSVRAVAGLPKAKSVFLTRSASCALTTQGHFCWGTTGFHASVPRAANDEGDCIAPPHPTLPPDARKLAERAVKAPGASGARAFGVSTAGMFGWASCAIDKTERARCVSAGAEQHSLELEERATGLRMKDDLTCFLTRERPRCVQLDFAGVFPLDEEDGAGGVAVDLALGENFRCELDDQGGVRCGGANHLGALGRGLLSTREDWAPVAGLEAVVDIAATRLGACAVRSDGSVWCWGGGSEQVGQPAPTFSVLPLELSSSP